MIAPFYKFGLFGDEMSLVVALLIGIGFGFFLERAGFGNARVLAAQFYFKDLRVLKVMFTAIITAMVGVTLLARFGLVDLSLVYLTPTFLWPQIVGGLLLGIGFVIGGYCPGTSCVSAATGRIDGIVYVTGIVGGIVGFAEVYPYIESFAHSSSLGKITLPGILHLPYGIMVFGVVAMALIAFLGAEFVEKWIGRRTPDVDCLLNPQKPFGPARKLAVGLLGLGLIAAVAGNPYRTAKATIDTRELALSAGNKNDHVWPAQLADWLIQGQNDFLVVDVRDATDYAIYHIPGAINVPLAALSPDIAPLNERIIFYSDGGIHAAQAWLLLRSLGYDRAYMLFGGLDEWKDAILFPTQVANPSPAQEVDFARRAAVAKFFGGTPRTGVASDATTTTMPELLAPPPPSSNQATTPVKKKRKEGC